MMKNEDKTTFSLDYALAPTRATVLFTYVLNGLF